MTYQIVNIGSAPNAKDGDTARAAFRKINENFGRIFGSPDAIIVTQSDDFDAQSYTTYLVDTTNQTIAAELPAIPAVGDVIKFVDSTGKFATNGFTVTLNGNKLMGNVTANVTYSTNFDVKEYFFASSAIGWIVK